MARPEVVVRRQIQPSIVAACLFLGGPLLAGDPPDTKVKVETGRQLYEAGDSVEITITNGRPGPIALPGCGSFTVEVFESDQYRPVPPERCVSEGDALIVPPGQHKLTFSPGSARSGQILRIAVAFGWGCEEGRPLSQARCQDFGTAWSSNFRVGGGG